VLRRVSNVGAVPLYRNDFQRRSVECPALCGSRSGEKAFPHEGTSGNGPAIRNRAPLPLAACSTAAGAPAKKG